MPVTRKAGLRKRAKLSSDESEPESLHSDALDDPPLKKLMRPTPSKPKSSSKQKSKCRKREVIENEEAGSGVDLKDGQQVVGRVVQAPKTGWVPPGQISQNTLDFLTKLQDPACNDREWFKLHEPVYRRTEKEFKDFIEEFTNTLTEADPEIPPLPPKDVIHRIYRDIRFSNDKTPYKTGLSASFSRSGRKGIFAFYHVKIKPGDQSVLAAGAWCPAKNELTTLRDHLLHSTPAAKTLHTVLSSEPFIAHFGPPNPHPRGERQSVFGHEDELKVAPKGVDKNHKDIDLLRCRSLAVSYSFTDAQVVAPEFMCALRDVADVMMPFVHCLNDLMSLPADAGSDENEEGDHEGSDDGETEEDE